MMSYWLQAVITAKDGSIDQDAILKAFLGKPVKNMSDMRVALAANGRHTVIEALF